MAQADWHDDPLGRYSKRYFDGRQWTSHVSERGVASVDPLGMRQGPRVSAAAPAPMLGPHDPAPHVPASTATGAPDVAGRSAAYSPGTPTFSQAGTPVAGHSGVAPARASANYPVASMGLRLGARLIDSVITFLLGYVLIFGVLIAGLSTGSEEGAIAGLLGAMVASILFGLFWEVLWVAKKGGTPGKLMLGIRVVDEHTGQWISGGRSFVRFLVPALGGLVFYVGALLVWLSPVFDSSRRNQGWHDRAANDLVVRVN